MRILIIQTAFLGDVILATPLVEQLKASFPNSEIDFLVRKGNEAVFAHHPHLRRVLIFDKRQHKYRNLFRLIREIRAVGYDHVINVQRFLTAGLLTVFSGARETVGFDKNPLARWFSRRVKHVISSQSSIHEVDRNLALIAHLTGGGWQRPRLYCSEEDFQVVPSGRDYVCIAPASVWFTKQLPAEKWIDLTNKIPAHYGIYLIGGPVDQALCEEIRQRSTHPGIEVVAGQISLLQSAALIARARMTFTNDSAPLHLASAMNAPVTAVFCSTVPAFGFGPLSETAHVVETEADVPCRPCGLHGKKACTEGHFLCAEIDVDKMLSLSNIR
ncbi:MAG: glycosyltransferase family 9 protein [Lewinella sp.]|nr:glycosyltransferase family 9 protein [Lewinella sp.]